jgi:hypothetical protein
MPAKTKMTARELIDQRLTNQLLAKTTSSRPEDVVAALGAVQAQDFTGAKWALGARVAKLTDAEVDRAVDEGRILRTHILRPTWHFVVPADIRWMLALTAPRVHGFSSSAYRKFELETKVFGRCHKAIVRALEGGNHLTRGELKAVLRKAGVESETVRLGLILMHAELSALICSGPRRGTHGTYALLEERVPAARALSTDEALGELTRRYVRSHGPVTIRDFAWWSGLSMSDARRGFASIASELEQHVLEDLTYYASANTPARRSKRTAMPTAWLLPNYDEYFIAYKDRDLVLRGTPTTLGARPEFAHLLSIDGRLTGIWKRTFSARTAGIDLRTFRPLTKPERAAVDNAVKRYATFLGVPVTVAFS